MTSLDLPPLLRDLRHHLYEWVELWHRAGLTPYRLLIERSVESQMIEEATQAGHYFCLGSVAVDYVIRVPDGTLEAGWRIEPRRDPLIFGASA